MTDYVSSDFYFANNFKSNKIKRWISENIFNFPPKIQVRKLQKKRFYTKLTDDFVSKVTICELQSFDIKIFED